MASSSDPSGSGGMQRFRRPLQVIIVSSVMFSFISYWRTAAVVLCDLASTSYYIGAIVEQTVGPAAPWFILGVMILSGVVCLVYIESCTLFVRGGVYRVVKTALGGFPAKIAVSALIFDYLLTGPISSVTAGQYLIGLVLDTLKTIDPGWQIQDEATLDMVKRWTAISIAVVITLYFFRQNLIGIHESSDKALKIMLATTVMVVVMLVWCGITLYVHGARNNVPLLPDLSKKVEYETEKKKDPVTGEVKEVWKRDEETKEFVVKRDENGRPVPKLNEVTGRQEDPLGFLDHLFPTLATDLRAPGSWLSIIGLIGLMIAFGHSILAMSGEETLAQVYREVESPKLLNFKKAALVVFVFSLMMTATISFFAVLIIPDEVRIKEYKDNLISGLALYVIGPQILKLVLSAFVVVVGSFILAGAVNTAIIGSNGVLNRVAEDGVLPAWFLKPHPKYGTTYRLLILIAGLQLLIILVTRGHTLVLGEAYAFGVVWSFVFQALSMVVLRFKDRRPREFKVPLNITVGSVEIPVGLLLILFFLLSAAVLNVLTKEIATISGLSFTLVFFVTFLASEWYHEKQRRGAHHEHVEQFNQQSAADMTPEALGLKRPYRKLVAIRSPQNLFMLETAMAETDPETTDVVVMTAKLLPADGSLSDGPDLDDYDQRLMTAVVQRAEKAGKKVVPLILPTNNPLYAVLRTARDLQAQELVMGASNKFTADEQLEQVAFYWIQLHEGQQVPLTVRLLSQNRDVYFDLAGGHRIPKVSERQARSVAELRAAGVGVDRVLLAYDGTPAGSDLYRSVLTMLDPQVVLALVTVPPADGQPPNGRGTLDRDREQARKLERELEVHEVKENWGTEIVRLAGAHRYDLIIVGLPVQQAARKRWPPAEWVEYVLDHAHCEVFLAAKPLIPEEVDQ